MSVLENKKCNLLQLTNILLVALFVISFFYSMNHFADGGCDGGTCGILLFFYSIPLLFAWLFAIISVNKSAKRKWSSFVFLVLSIGLTLWLVLTDFDISELKTPGYLLFLIHVFSIVIYFRKTPFK